jgi:hypothetical protein
MGAIIASDNYRTEKMTTAMACNAAAFLNEVTDL